MYIECYLTVKFTELVERVVAEKQEWQQHS